MTKTLLTFVAMLSLHASALAAEIDAKKSSISWKGSKITGDSHIGQISPKSSSMKVVDGQISSGEVVFAMNSITVGDLEGQWRDKFLRHLQSADFFDVANFPTATLKLTSVVNGKATGELTIKGITQPIAFTMTKKDAEFVGKATFDRAKFGVKYGSGSFFEDLGDKMINDEVEIEFKLVLAE